MTQEEKRQIADIVKRRICSCYFGCKYEHILKALDIIDKTGAYEHFFEPILNYREEITIDSDKLFSVNIDDSINYLLELKKDGWTGIVEKWSGYEDNYFVACKYIKEPDDAYKSRLEKCIKGYIPNILEEEKKIKEKEEMIEKLKKELNELKNKKLTMGLTFLTTMLLYIGIICTTMGICKDNVTMLVIGGIFIGIHDAIINWRK